MKVFNHGIHIILDVLTCGLWLPVHLILWAAAPTVPIGGHGSAAAAASTTVVLPPSPHPAMPPYPQQATQQLPMWAIDEAREALPADAPWAAIESMAWQAVQRGPRAAAAPPAPPAPLPDPAANRWPTLDAPGTGPQGTPAELAEPEPAPEPEPEP
ncbi:hypothetical protein [Nocardioides humi]|uniref:Uncharacterized protein n=1 Tax=Nocardioides humi TaxID=449461 RepID=A0ABN2ARG6_9ACTN|nr:hypothetical protein [Nocardioides humi]